MEKKVHGVEHRPLGHIRRVLQPNSHPVLPAYIDCFLPIQGTAWGGLLFVSLHRVPWYHSSR